jgi:hypothetical protein
MADMIDMMGNNLLMSVIYARTLYTDMMTRLTLSYFQNCHKNSLYSNKQDNQYFSEYHHVNHVIVSKGVFVPKMDFFTDIMTKSLIMSIMSGGLF